MIAGYPQFSLNILQNLVNYIQIPGSTRNDLPKKREERRENREERREQRAERREERGEEERGERREERGEEKRKKRGYAMEIIKYIKEVDEESVIAFCRTNRLGLYPLFLKR